MALILTLTELTEHIGDDELQQIAGVGGHNTVEGRQVDAPTVERALRFADELITGFVVPRHPWIAGRSLDDVPDLLKGFAADIVRYRLRDRDNNSTSISETVKDRYDMAMKSLRDIAAGKMDLIDTTAGEDAAPSAEIDRARIYGAEPTADTMIEDFLR